MTGRILSNAPVSWGVYEAATAPVAAETYLAQVAAAGYGGTELGPAGFLPEDPGHLNAILEAHGLDLVGAVYVHDFYGAADALDAGLDRTAPLLAAEGARVLTVMDAGRGYGGAPPAGLARTLDRATDRLRDRHGLTLAFHPHVLTAIETGDQVDRLLAESRVALCLDTGHHAFWGADPIACLDRHRARIGAIHLKNVRRDLVAAVTDGRLTAAEACQAGAFCPLAEGVVDIPAFLAALGPFDGPVVVEQDWTPGAPPPAETAAANAAFLAEAWR